MAADLSFPAVLRRYRLAARLTQEQLAERSGLTARSVSQLERGRVRYPRPESVRLLGAALGLAEAELAEFLVLARSGYWADRDGGLGTDATEPSADPRTKSAGIAPAQLPPGSGGFAGRRADLAILDSLLAGHEPGQGPLIVAISGTGGVGKTALAIRWAHHVRDRLPDGQLYVNLRGFDPAGQVMSSTAALRGFLDALGLPAERIPVDPDAQTGLYRSLLAGRRMLVVLDNARDADHARPLLPGTATSVAVVTSRDPLTDLVTVTGAHPLSLDLLSAEEARELLARRVGPVRIAAEPDAVEQIITACTRLPLALAVVAARAATHPTFSLTALAAELTAGNRAGRLDDGDLLAQVRAVFSWSYTTLTAATARLFRLLGLHPGPDTSAAAASSLTAAPPADTRASLAELTRAGLLTEHAPGRYHLHDLLAAYAADLTSAVDPDSERRAATTRLLDHYTYTAHTADQLLTPQRAPIAVPLTPPAFGVNLERITHLPAALAWLTAEHPILLAAQRLAASTGHDIHAWQLARTLHTFLSHSVRWHDLTDAWQTALAAAHHLDDLTAAAAAHRGAAEVGILLGDYGGSYTHLHRALDLSTEPADPIGQAKTHLGLGKLRSYRNQHDQALDHAQQALTIFRTVGDRHGQAQALNGIGWEHVLLGNHTQALTCCEQALTLYQQIGDRYGEAATWDSLGYVHHHLAQHTKAADCYQHALGLFRDHHDRYGEAETLIHIGDTHQAAGKSTAARTAWTEALHILTDLDHPDTAGVHAKLATSPAPPLANPSAHADHTGC